jgi:hypothetical protein
VAGLIAIKNEGLRLFGVAKMNHKAHKFSSNINLRALNRLEREALLHEKLYSKRLALVKRISILRNPLIS